MSRKKKRKIDKLTASEKKILDSMVESGATFTHIADHFQEKGYDIPRFSVSRYAADWKEAEAKTKAAEIAAKAMLDKLEKAPEFNVAGALTKIMLTLMAEQILDPDFKFDLAGCDPLEITRVLQSASRTENDLETVKAKFRKEQEEKERKARQELEKLQDNGDISEEAKEKIVGIYGLPPIHNAN